MSATYYTSVSGFQTGYCGLRLTRLVFINYYWTRARADGAPSIAVCWNFNTMTGLRQPTWVPNFVCLVPAVVELLAFLTRAWPGGGRLTPPPLPNIRDSSKTNSAIDVKLGRPSHTTIWHRPWKFFWNPSENFWDMVDFVTSLHATFGRKLAKLRGSVEDAVFNKNANEKHQKT